MQCKEKPGRQAETLDLIDKKAQLFQHSSSVPIIMFCRRTSRIALFAPNLNRWRFSSIRSLATVEQPSSSSSSLSELVLYKGEFARKLTWLRRVSFASSVVSLIGIPTVAFIGIGGGSVPLVGQVMIVGTALFTSLSSTAFLHVVTTPYCVSLVELPSGPETSTSEKTMRATRLNIYGNLETTDFTRKDAIKLTSGGHPFASVRIKDRFFYIFGGKIEDVSLRRLLSNEH